MSNNGKKKNKYDVLDPAASKNSNKGSGLKSFGNLKNAEGITIKEQFFVFLKNPYVLVTILIVIILIGLLGFLFNMPGLMMGKLKQIAQGLWDGVQSHFLTTADAFINDDDITKLAQYLEDMQYDLIGYGFIRAEEVGDYPTYLELDEEYYMNSDRIYVKVDSNGQEIPYDGYYYGSTGHLIDNSTGEKFEETNYVKDKYGIMYWASDVEANSAPDGENHIAGQIAKVGGDDSLLRTYLMSDYRISVLRNDDEGLLEKFGTKLSQIYGGSPNAWSKGLIKIYKKETKDDGTIKVSNLWDGASTFWVNDVNIVDNATKLSIRKGVFNRPMEFSLDGWTGRYGLSLEFLLSLHLGTMAPDLVTAMIQSFDTEVQVYVEEIPDAQVVTKYIDYEVDSYEDNVEGNNEEVTIAEITTVLEEDYRLAIQDGALVEWVNGLTLSKKKCLTILRNTGLSSPPDCIYKAVGYVVLPPEQTHYGGENDWQMYSGATTDENYLSYAYGVNDSFLDEFDYRIYESNSKDEYYDATAYNTLFSLRYDCAELGNVSAERLQQGLDWHVMAKRNEIIDAAKNNYQLKEEPVEIGSVYNTDTGRWDLINDVDISDVEYNNIETSGYSYRIERYIKSIDWSIYGVLDEENKFQQKTEEEFNADDNGIIEETTGYMDSYIYKIYQTGSVDGDGSISYYSEDSSLAKEQSSRGRKLGQVQFYKAKELVDNEEIGDSVSAERDGVLYTISIYYKQGIGVSYYCTWEEDGKKVEKKFETYSGTSFTEKYEEWKDVLPKSLELPPYNNGSTDRPVTLLIKVKGNLDEEGNLTSYTFKFDVETNTSSSTVDIAHQFLIWKINDVPSPAGDTMGDRLNVLTVESDPITEPYLYDVLYINFLVRDKTIKELLLCGILEIDEDGNYVTNNETGHCSVIETGVEDITKCCSICQRYVKRVVRALAFVQDTNYEYYQPYIARVVGSWFRDTYFIIPNEEDGALKEYYGAGNSPVGSWGIGGGYIKVDEDYLNSSGEYWTEYEMKTKVDEDGNIIELDEYQLYYLNPDGSTSQYKLEEWLEKSDDAVDANGERYTTKEDAEKDGHVFVKKVKLLKLSDIKNNTNVEEGGGRETPYLDGTLWSAYSLGTGTKTDWIKVNLGEVDIVDDVLEMVNNEGEFYYKLSSTKSIEQEEDAIRTETNITVKNLFRYRQFYIYDGTVAKAEEIQKDREKVNALIISYFNNSDYHKGDAVNHLAEYGRYALRETYIKNETLVDWTNDENVAESWLEWQLDMYYRANNEKSLSDKEKTLFKLDELCEYGINNTFINEKGETETFLDKNYYTLDNHSLDPRNRHLISTVNITKSSLDAFSILENVNTLDADYQYRDFKELIVELNYFDKEDLSDAIEEVFTWLVPTYSTTWPILSIDKQNTDYGTLIHSQESIDFLIEVYERLLEEEKSYYGIEDTETEEPDTEVSEGTEQKKALTQTEQTLMLLQEATSYAENDIVVSPVTGKIMGYGTHSRINAYTQELENVGYVKIEIMGYGEMQDKSKSYFTKDMLSDTGLTDEEKDTALKGLNAFYDEYKNQCAGYILTIDGIDISDLEKEFVNVKNTEGSYVEYEELCKYELNETIALYNSKEQKRREEEELAKKEAPFFINYNANYSEINGEYFSSEDGISGYYVKEGAYLGKTQSATKRTGDKNSEYIENPGALVEDIEVVEPSTDAILDINKLYKEYLGDTNPDYLRLILLDDEMTVVDNVEDYFPGFEEESELGSGSDIKFSGSFSEYGLYWMIVGFEGLKPYEVKNGFVAVDIGDGTVTAGGSGITNWCNSYFWELGYEKYVNYKKGSNVGMEVGDVIPGNVIMDIKAVVIDAHVANVEKAFPNNNFTQCQVEALASVSYNFGHIPNSLKNAINTNSNLKEVWEHLSDSQAEKYPGLVTRRKAEYKLFSEGFYSNGSGIMNFSTNTPYSDYINGDNTVTYN